WKPLRWDFPWLQPTFPGVMRWSSMGSTVCSSPCTIRLRSRTQSATCWTTHSYAAASGRIRGGMLLNISKSLWLLTRFTQSTTNSTQLTPTHRTPIYRRTSRLELGQRIGLRLCAGSFLYQYHAQDIRPSLAQFL